MKTIVYLVGLPAVGKSTYIKKHYPDYVVISNDEIIEEYAKKHNMKYNEAWGKVSFKFVKNECMNRFNKAVSQKKNIVIDNTNMTVKSRRAYEHPGYIKKAVVFRISDAEHKKRIEKRLKETGKFVPEDAVKNMIAKYVEPSKSEGFEEITFVN